MSLTKNIFAGFPDYVPEEVCLSCQGCCRFQDATSQWRPKISTEEIDMIPKDGAGMTDVYSPLTVDQNHFLKASHIPQPHQHHANCRCIFFDIEKNICKIYTQRPFDCRLYPFLLVKKEKDYFVGVHLNCPYIEKTKDEIEFKEYTKKVKDFFSQAGILQYLRRNLYLAGDYQDFQNEIDYLFKLDI